MKYVLITGSAHGLGLALTKKYLQEGYMVFGCVNRKGTEDLYELRKKYTKRLEILAMDISNTENVHNAFKTIREETERLDLVINNAGILPRDSGLPLEETEVDDFLETLNINTIGAFRVIKHAIPLLRKGEEKVILNVSSAGGSLTHITELDTCQDDYPYAYCMSKAALNMGSAILQRYCRGDGIKVLCVHPGVMKTRMNESATGQAAEALILPEVSAESIYHLVQNNKGKLDGPFFYQYTGEVFPY